ncbi:DNA (cytosine-5-)-methyltransferase [Actinotalea sp. K2]|uniref:DNA (cytosine-5-)-methyltransferase n=1 Tax=Actinotalea sp. K2 TaxID=2939438 RepID=UPI0020173DA7|nr:DNA (cytosine-5-)-methyltransferase [Actinotalea sp. K2]MCL3863004.1 DNA (cytosine-5-)-methyltransferase [Actinotalea sp. K2]
MTNTSSDALETLAPLAQALAEPTRRRVLAVLARDGHAYPGELAVELGLAPTALSHHLTWLRRAGLTVAVLEGRRRRHLLSSDDLQAMLRELSPAATGGGSETRYAPSRIPSSHPHHQPRDLTAQQREAFRRTATLSRLAKTAALAGEGPEPIHDVNVPKLSAHDLMPERSPNGLRALSLFSGGGGLDLGFARAGMAHVASFELMQDAANTLQKAHPDWQVFGGPEGDVGRVNWKAWRDQVEVLHGGPPCQPFSVAGRQRGQLDPRDGWPAYVRAVRAVRPLAFVAENVPALASKKFADYVEQTITGPLGRDYTIVRLLLRAEEFGVPQTRRRVVWVGFRRRRDAARYEPPAPTHAWVPDGEPPVGLPRTLGVREALGLPDIGFDALSPTIRSTLTGPRHTTSILNSTAAQRVFAQLQIWPNGVAPTRERARAFVAANGHFRLSVPDVALLQGFPDDWPFQGATYMQLGQIGNAVPPPMAYAVASSVAAALA